MKVKELIAELAKHDPEMEVFVPMADEGWLEEPTLEVRRAGQCQIDEDCDPGERVIFLDEPDPEFEEEAGYQPDTMRKVIVLGEIS